MVLYSESAGASVRPARTADLPAVAAIFAHYVCTSVVTFEETPPTVADWADKLADLEARGLPFLVADGGGTVVGYAYAAPWRPKPAYRHTAENTVYLSPAHTGRGLGRALMTALLEACATAGVRRLIAVVVDEGADRGTGEGAGRATDEAADASADQRTHGDATDGTTGGTTGGTIDGTTGGTDEGAAASPNPNPSLALHRALGFAEAGRLTAVGHKHGRWLDTVLLQRDVFLP